MVCIQLYSYYVKYTNIVCLIVHVLAALHCQINGFYINLCVFYIVFPHVEDYPIVMDWFVRITINYDIYDLFSFCFWLGRKEVWYYGVEVLGQGLPLGYISWAYLEIVIHIFLYASTTYTVFGLDYVTIVYMLIESGHVHSYSRQVNRTSTTSHWVVFPLTQSSLWRQFLLESIGRWGVTYFFGELVPLSGRRIFRMIDAMTYLSNIVKVN